MGFVTEEMATEMAMRDARAHCQREKLFGEDAERALGAELKCWEIYIGKQIAYERCPVVMRLAEQAAAKRRGGRHEEMLEDL